MSFNGITNLRDRNEYVRMEPWQLEEIKKCANDPLYFIENYIYINTKDDGMQIFKLREYQKEVINKYNDNRFVCLKFPRQSGKCCSSSEIICIKNRDGEEMEFTIKEFFELLEELNEK